MFKALLVSIIVFASTAFSAEMYDYEVSGVSTLTEREVSGHLIGSTDEILTGNLCYADTDECYDVYGTWQGLGMAIVNDVNGTDSFEVEVEE